MDSSVNAHRTWAEVPHRIRAGDILPEPWESLFGTLRSVPPVGGCVAVGQIGQSLDGRIATLTGHSRYINGSHGLCHLHRLRALVDAVVVGAGTVRADDPQLTVRLVVGPNPVRVVIDPRGTLAGTSRAFAADGVRRMVITRTSTRLNEVDGVETVPVPDTAGIFAPAAILEALAARGLRRVLIEGGAQTVSRFVSSGCLDRLHVVVAPVILGSGIPGIALPPIANMNEALRVPIQVSQLGDEVLFDCDLSAASRREKSSGEALQRQAKLSA
jgi:diaminohydroxyphosphoribosylaminopyrimidine deaminase/5-amino-6-(5-phosphoribosylamino)uracil reductase